MRRLLSLVIVAALGAAALVVAAPAATAVGPWVAPGFERSIGSRGEAGVYAWGIADNPVTGEVLVGDYLNFQIERYDHDGNFLGSFWVPLAQRKGHPESLAVDPRDGAIYASDRSGDGDKGFIAKFDKFGNFLYHVQTTANYHAWLTIGDDGALYLADSHFGNDVAGGTPPRIRKYTVDDATHSTTEVASWGEWGEGPGQWRWITGFDVDAQKHVYAADPILRTVHVFDASDDQNVEWLYDIGAGTPQGVFTGDLRGVAVDEAHGWVYAVDAQGAQVEKFTTTGTHLASFGSEGSGPGQFADGGRQLALDSSGDVWVADYGNFRFHHFSPDGVLEGTFPDPAQPAPVGGLAQPRDVDIDPVDGGVWAVETNNHRFQHFGADGSPLGAWGFRNSNPPFGLNYPRGIGIDPATRNVWVVNSSGDQILVYAQTPTGVEFVRTIGILPRSDEPGHFLKPMDLAFSNGLVYVSAYNGPIVHILDAATGNEVGQIARQNNGVSVDPATGTVYLVSYTRDRVFRYSATGTFLGQWGAAGTGPGQMQQPWSIDFVNGAVYIVDAQLNRVMAYTPTGSFLGQWGTKGAKPGQFNSPSGLSHDAAGNIYVADTGNDRIQVFSPTVAAPVGDAVKPTASITTPAGGATLPDTSVPVLSGVAADNVRVGTVEVALQDRDTNLWWDAKVAAWNPTKQWSLTGVVGTSATSKTWFMPFVGYERGGRYQAQVRALDSTGNFPTSGLPMTQFSVGGGTPLDTTPPDGTVTVPVANQVFQLGGAIFNGLATDDRGVAGVSVGIQNRVTKLWWRSDGTWGAFQLQPANVTSPGATNTGWTYHWSGAVSGDYGLQVVARDAAGNQDPTKPFVRFLVS